MRWPTRFLEFELTPGFRLWNQIHGSSKVQIDANVFMPYHLTQTQWVALALTAHSLKGVSMIGTSMEKSFDSTLHKEELCMDSLVLDCTYMNGMLEVQYYIVLDIISQTKWPAAAIQRTKKQRSCLPRFVNWNISRSTDFECQKLGTSDALWNQNHMHYINSTTRYWPKVAKSVMYNWKPQESWSKRHYSTYAQNCWILDVFEDAANFVWLYEKADMSILFTCNMSRLWDWDEQDTTKGTPWQQ